MTPELQPGPPIDADGGVSLASYTAGDESAPPVLAVHGFASGARLNWETAGWVRVLVRAGYRVIAYDQRGHGDSDAPHDPAAYSLGLLARDAIAVCDGYGIDRVDYLGYSLGARVGWRLGIEQPSRLRSLALGGMPLGDPLALVDVAAARRAAAGGEAPGDPLTAAYLRMAAGVPGNDTLALMALVDGLRSGMHAELRTLPSVPVLTVAGANDPVAPDSERIARAVSGTFVSLPGRGHLNAVTARAFKDAVLGFLAERP